MQNGHMPEQMQRKYKKWVYKDSYGEESSLDCFKVNFYIDSEQAIINWTKLWIETYFPAYSNLEIV